MGFRTMAADFIGGFFAFDARVYRSLKLLILKPGSLTHDYLRGRRQRYVPPFKLYLFATFLAFLMLNLVDARVLKINLVDKGQQGFSFQQSGSPDGNNGGETKPAAVDVEDQHQGSSGGDSAEILSESAKESESENSFLGRFYSGMARASADPKRANKEVVQLIPKGMFLLLPWFALLLRIFYRNLEFRYPQWFVFSLYFHAFAFFFITIGAVFIHLGFQTIFRVLVCVVFPLYLFIALRKLTQQSTGKTLFKLFGFSLVYLLSFATVIMLIGIWIILNY